ncbi:MAG: phage tail protein [Clostridia bacterium]|nr:phage tail protein [Clostridia bacterium]
MSFYVDTAHEQYRIIEEESVIIASNNEWLVKKIDDDKIDCTLNFDFLKRRVYRNFKSETKSLSEVLETHLPSDWIVIGANITTARRSIEFEYCTDYDVVYSCMNTYEVYFVWHILDKKLEIFSQENLPPTGEYLTSELNLRSLSFKGNTTKFATRLYAYGADGLSIADAMVDDGNGGKIRYGLEYVENTAFANKVVCAYWNDDRFKIAENLFAEANKKLVELSNPVRSYECDVVDLAKRNDEYAFLKLKMHSTVTLIDVERGIKVDHRIVEYKEHPDNDDLNTVVLSCVPDTISFRIRSESEKVKEEIEKNSNTFNEAISMATAMLTGAFGGYIHKGETGEILIADNENLELAEVVWRWNLNGFGKSTTGVAGPYTTSITIDDTFTTNLVNAMVIRGSLIEAGSIVTESISQEYTDGITSSSFSAAKGEINARFSELQDYLSNKNEDGQLDILKKQLSSIQAKLDSITFTYTEEYLGGINYSKNSSGLNGLSDDWQYTGSVAVQSDSDIEKNTVSDSAFVLSRDSTLSQTIDNLIIGKTYTISVKIKKTGSLSASMTVGYNNNQTETFYSTVENEKHGWETYHITLKEVKSSSITITASTRDNYLYVADVMVCEGSTLKSWTPAKDEIYTDEVKIDKNGVRVSNKSTTQESLMTNEGLIGRYNNEEVFSVKGKETVMTKGEAREQFTVGKCMFIKYENSGEKGLNIVILD